MTHDPLCPVVTNPVTMILHGGTEIIVGSYCQCELIAKVREDDRNKAVIRIEALTPTYPEGEDSVFVDRARAIDAALGDDVE